MLLLLHASLLSPGSGVVVAAIVLLASAYGFSQADAKVKTTDYFFTGFPSYWNLVALYLFVWRLPQTVNAAILFVLAVLVFVPLRYVYPSRTETLRKTTNVLGALWGLLLVWIVWRMPATDGPWTTLSLIFPTYYMLLSSWLNWRPRPAA
jgi:phosphatidylcholine synthase